MALLPCRECGNEVSAEAPTCPKCGVPAPVGKSAQLVVTRKKALRGAINLVQVTVDDLDGGWATLSMGERAGFPLLPGRHQLLVSFDSNSDYYSSYEFEIAHDETLNAVVQIGKGAWFE